MKRVYSKWCQGTSAFMSKANMRKNRKRYVPKLVYSVSVLLLKNILVWRNVFTLWTILVPYIYANDRYNSDFDIT